MPKEIDPALRVRAVRLGREHRAEYPSTTAAVARQEASGTSHSGPEPGAVHLLV